MSGSLALLLFVLPPCAAQTRVAVDAAVAAPGGSAGATVTGANTRVAAPTLLSLSLVSPSLAPTLLSAPALTLKPAASAAAPSLSAAPLAAAEAPPLLPASVLLSAPLESAGSAAAIESALKTPAGAEDAPLESLSDVGRRLFGETSFGATEISRYGAALADARWSIDERRAAVLVESAAALAAGAGIAARVSSRKNPYGEGAHPALVIEPRPKGHRLNRLAWDMRRSHGATVEYVPQRTHGGVAAFNGRESVLFLPSFGHEDAYPAVLHEARHAHFAKRLARGDLSPFHAAIRAYEGGHVARGAVAYTEYLSLEELSTFPKTLLHVLLNRNAPEAAGGAAESYLAQYDDILRSVDWNLAHLSVRLADGSLKAAPLPEDAWAPFPGGRWMAVYLPHAGFALPVEDEPPPAPRGLLDRVLGKQPRTPAQNAAARLIAVLRPLISASREESAVLARALVARDAAAARRSAARLVSLADGAERAYQALRPARLGAPRVELGTSRSQTARSAN